VSDSGRNDNADEPLALALAQGKTVAAAAESVGISERTVYRRLSEPSFRRRVRDLRGEMVQSAIGRLTTLSGHALDELEQLLKNADGKIRMRAVKLVLDGVYKVSLGDLAEEVRELRSEMEAIKRAHGAAGAGGAGPAAGGPGAGGAAGEPAAGEGAEGPDRSDDGLGADP
jgi:hypothetical protein